jgi:hypothetical protein
MEISILETSQRVPYPIVDLMNPPTENTRESGHMLEIAKDKSEELEAKTQKQEARGAWRVRSPLPGGVASLERIWQSGASAPVGVPSVPQGPELGRGMMCADWVILMT